MAGDYRIRATAADGLLRAVAVNTTETARQAEEIHQAYPVAAAALGRLISAAAILATDVKDDSRVVVEVDGGGPLGRLVAEIRGGRDIRARIQHPEVNLDLRADGKLAVGQAVGQDGYFRVLREEPVSGGWYQGQVELVSGEIGEDLLHYYTQSEQVPSAVALGVLVGQEGIQASGGILLQALPGLADDRAQVLTERFQRLDSLSRRLAAGETLEAVLGELLGSDAVLFEPEPIGWHCWCERGRIEDILLSLPDGDYQDLINDGGAEVTCHFCRTAYHFTQEELETLRRGA
ncbi:Hsp33 protein [Sulfobacillus acidophilus TPY]|uniref:33 kDa chaperonin n=1 Tax=Sulfobacillus acidophilus (strain ATCC 700253 / DSM 10332 / NAL) TaxID=679936 RepID=G8TW41_SULAD|nr:Hsp33 protein [Sulfobacillus acidophilus TPY]AEW05968.1 33 kDa chaperonin [Sulfobacillus acidophilus DSM 10332]